MRFVQTAMACALMFSVTAAHAEEAMVIISQSEKGSIHIGEVCAADSALTSAGAPSLAWHKRQQGCQPPRWMGWTICFNGDGGVTYKVIAPSKERCDHLRDRLKKDANLPKNKNAGIWDLLQAALNAEAGQ